MFEFDPLVALYMGGALERAGFSVTVALDETGLDVARRERPDGVVMADGMGRHLAGVLRANGFAGRVILTTGEIPPPAVPGCDAVLSRPLTPCELIAALQGAPASSVQGSDH